MIANRLGEVMPYIISKDQVGFIKNRYIGENILEPLSTIEVCEKEGLPGIIVSFDFEKAFDRVEWDSLNLVFKH